MKKKKKEKKKTEEEEKNTFGNVFRIRKVIWPQEDY